MKVVSSDNEWEELRENWARRLISLICCIFLMLTCCLLLSHFQRRSRIGGNSAAPVGRMSSLLKGRAVDAAFPQLDGKVERVVQRTPRRVAANHSW